VIVIASFHLRYPILVILSDPGRELILPVALLGTQGAGTIPEITEGFTAVRYMQPSPWQLLEK
jgi:hypothetical protein